MERETQMKKIVIGLAAALAMGGATAVIAQETGSIGGAENYGSLISSLGTSTAPDLTAFSDTSSVSCVKVSTLAEDGSNNAAALDSAISANQDKLSTLHSGISANQTFIDRVESSCAVAELDPSQILVVESSADGAFTVWIDDRAGAGGASTMESGASTSGG